ncbi:MAG: alpha-L-fucosidase [Phycisphaerae bacterium]|nr:alpha-L-fucosidase [Phycisphaerae bacterium]
MKKIIFVFIVFFMTINLNAQSPEPYGPVPTASQLRWHEMEYYSLICYGLNTYTQQEWGYGDIAPKLFNPSNLDTDQWARVCKDAGMKGIILVAKHHDGFCLWPSETTKYTVSATPWKDGKGDVLGDLAKSCEKYDLKLGIYISPWDRNHAEYGREAYVKAYHQQWREVLQYSDDIFEVWFDGANGGTGYYGGAKESRSITKDYYQYDKVYEIIKKAQPQTIFFGQLGGVTKDTARWVGNESGYADKSNWATFTYPDKPNFKLLEKGLKDGKYWMPAEADTTLTWPKAWYYHANTRPRTLKQLLDVYYQTIGRNATFNLGIAIAPDGQISPADAEAMLSLKKQLDQEFSHNLIEKAIIKSSNQRPDFPAQNCIDQSSKTYWATTKGDQKATITIDFQQPTTFNRILLQEYIALGQRIDGFTIEAWDDNKWKTIEQQTTIGYKRILRTDTIKTDKIKITFQTDAPCITLANIGIYNAPIILSDPIIKVDINGMLSIDAPKGADIFYVIGKNVNNSSFQKYIQSIDLSKGGKVQAYAVDPATANKTSIVTAQFGIAKTKMKISDCTFANTGDAHISRIIDGNPESMWHTHDSIKGRQIPPQSFTIGLSMDMTITGFAYTPRHDGCFVGLVDRYQLHVSSDNINWQLASQGEFHNIKNNPIKQIIKLDQPVKARYIKFTATHALEDNDCVAICEFDVLAD